MPRFSTGEISAALFGRRLHLRNLGAANPSEIVQAFEIMDNFRASHAFPLNTFQVVLRNRSRRVTVRAIVSQRLKREVSIINKLILHRTMRFSQMQDIGGCRSVVDTVDQVRALESVYEQGRSKSRLVGKKDYIAAPRRSGYRSLHLVFRYDCGPRAHLKPFNGLLVEIQIRSQIQHAWATAIETVGALTDQALKASEGEERWLGFFKRCSSLFAFREGTPAVPGTVASASLAQHIRAEARELEVRERLMTYRKALQVIETSGEPEQRYFLLYLQPSASELSIRGFREGQIDTATREYAALEQSKQRPQNSDVVLVRADSIAALRRAYPNYFLDTELFVRTLDESLDGEIVV